MPGQPMDGVLWPESGGHSIYQDSDQGRDFRRRLVGGGPTAKDISTIPECFHRRLEYMEREKAVGGSLVTAEDYSEAGLLKPISSQKWVQFWARARAGKRGGEPGPSHHPSSHFPTSPDKPGLMNHRQTPNSSQDPPQAGALTVIVHVD